MGASVSYLTLTVTGLLALLVAVFFLEIVSAVTLSRRQHPKRSDQVARPPVAVLVPAHNESVGVLPTLANLQDQLCPHDRLLVVADNCSDDTAAVARAAGAEVIERNDPTR